jgi:hypothetical protein
MSIALTSMATLVLGLLHIAAQPTGDLYMYVFVGSEETTVSHDSSYCLMPASFPFRPGDMVHLRDDDGRLIDSKTLIDSVALYPATPPLTPGGKCELVVQFPAVPSAEGYMVQLHPSVLPKNRHQLPPVQVTWTANSFEGYQVAYDAAGFKVCDFAEESPLQLNAPIQTIPPLLFLSPERSSFYRSELEEFGGVETCALYVEPVFLVSNEYRLAVGAASVTLD